MCLSFFPDVHEYKAAAQEYRRKLSTYAVRRHLEFQRDDPVHTTNPQRKETSCSRFGQNGDS